MTDKDKNKAQPFTKEGKGLYPDKTIAIGNELGMKLSSSSEHVTSLTANSEAEGELSLDQLHEVTDALERYTIETPTLEDSKQLIKALSARNPSSSASRKEPSTISPWSRLLFIMRAVRSQTRLFSISFWLITAFLILLAGWLGLFVKEGMTQPIVYIVPAIAALSVCVAFRSYGTPMFLLELSMPITPGQIIYGRLLFILAYNMIFATVASLFLMPSVSELGVLIVSWLLPLGIASLTALTAMLYMRFVNAIIISLVVWSVQLILNERLGAFYFLGVRQQENWAASILVGCSYMIILFVLVHLKVARIQQPGGV